jgi:hypothetical protein
MMKLDELKTEEEILDWYKTASNMEKLIFYRSAHNAVEQIERLREPVQRLVDRLVQTERWRRFRFVKHLCLDWGEKKR